MTSTNTSESTLNSRDNQLSQAPANLASRSSPLPNVVAIIQAYNEAEILEATLAHLASQGIAFYLLDNWSTDDTLRVAKSFLGQGLIGFESFPQIRPTNTDCYHLPSVLRRKELLACEFHRLGARWMIHYDADELRESPWPGISLHDGLQRVAAEGYNAIDHVVLHFKPTNEHFRRGMSPARHFTHFTLEANAHPGRHVKAWLQPPHPVDLTTHAGHSVLLPHRRVYPIPFLIKHYPILSTAHGQRKVLLERKPRYSAECRALGWHIQYDAIQDQQHQFVLPPDHPGLHVYDETSFKQTLRENATKSSPHRFGTVRTMFRRLFGST